MERLGNTETPTVRDQKERGKLEDRSENGQLNFVSEKNLAAQFLISGNLKEKKRRKCPSNKTSICWNTFCAWYSQSSEQAVLMSVGFCVFCLIRTVFKVHRGPVQDGRLVLYVFDCCSESRDVETGFRAIIIIRKAQAHGDHRTSVIGVLQSYWLRAACGIARRRCVCALHQVWLYKVHSLLKTPTAVFTFCVTVHRELCLSHTAKLMEWAHHYTAVRTVIKNKNLFVCFWRNSPPSGPGCAHSRGF